MLERSRMTKRYAVPAFSLATFLPCMVSPIVKPGPTVPLTVFAVAAEPLPVAASAAAATAPSTRDRVREILRMSFASLRHELVIEPGSDGPILEGRDGDSHR
jgi:hypothetical protein